jgi:hypothetical protein
MFLAQMDNGGTYVRTCVHTQGTYYDVSLKIFLQANQIILSTEQYFQK